MAHLETSHVPDLSNSAVRPERHLYLVPDLEENEPDNQDKGPDQGLGSFAVAHELGPMPKPVAEQPFIITVF